MNALVWQACSQNANATEATLHVAGIWAKYIVCNNFVPGLGNITCGWMVR